MGQGILGKLFNTGGRQQPAFSDAATDPLKAQIVINTISDGIAIIDAQGIIQLFNPAAEALTGWKASDAISLDYRSIFNLYNNAGRPIENAENPMAQSLRARQTVTNDKIYIETASGKRIQILLKATPIIRSQDSQAVDGIVIVFRDITRERAEQNAQTDFISTASHEMRTPVATIEGYLGMILNPNICTIDDKARDYANKAHQSIQHLGQLFQDLLDVTKADDSRLEMRPTLIDATIAARELTRTFDGKASAKGLQLIFANDEENVASGHGIKTITPPSIIYVDLDYFNEALGNIIDNAIKYTQHGDVTVRVISDNDRVRVQVTDSGIGIPAEDVPHLFQKFYRVDNSETREVGGTGLGLYLIKKLTTAMGGTVGVKSDYGHGSTFWMEFDSLNREQAIQKAREIKAREDGKLATLRQVIS